MALQWHFSDTVKIRAAYTKKDNDTAIPVLHPMTYELFETETEYAQRRGGTAGRAGRVRSRGTRTTVRGEIWGELWLKEQG